MAIQVFMGSTWEVDKENGVPDCVAWRRRKRGMWQAWSQVDGVQKHRVSHFGLEVPSQQVIRRVWYHREGVNKNTPKDIVKF